MQILDSVLFVLIYGGSTLFIGAVLLDIQGAWVKHTSTATNTFISNAASEVEATVEVEVEVATIIESPVSIRSEVRAPMPILVKDDFAISAISVAKKSSKTAKIEELREKCEQAGIQWKRAHLNESTGRKRNLTEAEMLEALSPS